MKWVSINPATEEIISEYIEWSTTDLRNTLIKAELASKDWKQSSLNTRLDLVSNLKKLIQSNRERIATLITREMGKTFREANLEVDRAVLFCDHALQRLDHILSKVEIPNPLLPASLIREPLGIILAITPWNVPFSTPVRLLLPAVLVGNASILKPAPNVAGCAMLFAELFQKAGFPDGLINIALLNNKLAEELIGDRLIKKVSFVGSTPVGRRLASIAGHHIKPVLLELGGSDPFIVLDDADIELAAKDAAAARCSNAGQVCCSSKRMIIDERVYEQFREKFLSEMKLKRTGDPMSESVDYGPLARRDIRDNLITQLEAAVKTGSNIILEGSVVPGQGYFHEPVVLEEPGEYGFSTDEEFFGPVASLFRAINEEHTVKIANMSRYGLGSAIYSNNTSRANNLAKKLENGFVYINHKPGLHPFIPFGGVKDSGFGKDCGDEAYYEYLSGKVIVGDVK
ncbi:MAG TPA: aldehyde dehydrogenase family protein [Oligoflexia bacterium]|nr:aldehyde dehydrogenase family protein [Oligoflexia bacterium]HMP47200.1 aldehyde dehydrogenase family protein [Oligoflexia bacterium]